MKLLTDHRSIRSYQSMEVKQSVIDKILESGIRASNTGNMQLYCVVVTRDEEKRKQLTPLHFNQPMVAQAPVLLTICMDINRFDKWCSLRNTKTDFKNLLWLLNSTIDASLLAQNMCVEAENNGLGICYLGTALYNAPEISKVLKLPAGVIPVTALTLGYPSVVPELTDRLPMKAVVHYEEYADFNNSEINELYNDKESLESSLKFIDENHKENLAQVYAEIRYKRQDNEFFSKKIYKMLKEQGFSFE